MMLTPRHGRQAFAANLNLRKVATLAAGFSVVLLLACGGAAPKAPVAVGSTGTSTLSIPDTLRALQTSGALPTLDTSPSIAGTDSNGNGVRDDLDKLIAGLPDSPAQQKALTQFAQALQSMMTVDLTNPAAVSAASLANNRAVTCIWQTYPTGQHNKVLMIEELSVNTLTRLNAYEKYNANRNGAVIPSLTGSTCN